MKLENNFFDMPKKEKTKLEEKEVAKPVRRKKTEGMKEKGIEKSTAEKKRTKSIDSAGKTEDLSVFEKKEKSATKKAGSAKKEAKVAEEQERHFARWTERDFLRTEEEKLFYKLAFVGGILAMLWAIKDESWLSAITFLTLLVVVVFELKSEQRQVEYEINIDGISIDGRLYRFDEVKSFDLMERGGEKIVHFQLKRSVFPTKDMILGSGQDVDFIEALLEYFLPRETQEDVLFNFKEEKQMTDEEFIDKKVDEYLKGNF